MVDCGMLAEIPWISSLCRLSTLIRYLEQCEVVAWAEGVVEGVDCFSRIWVEKLNQQMVDWRMSGFQLGIFQSLLRETASGHWRDVFDSLIVLFSLPKPLWDRVLMDLSNGEFKLGGVRTDTASEKGFELDPQWGGFMELTLPVERRIRRLASTG